MGALISRSRCVCGPVRLPLSPHPGIGFANTDDPRNEEYREKNNSSFSWMPHNVHHSAISGTYSMLVDAVFVPPKSCAVLYAPSTAYERYSQGSDITRSTVVGSSST